MGDSSLALGMTASQSTPGPAGLLLAVSVFSEGELTLRGSRFALGRRLLRGWRRGQLHSDDFTHASLFHCHAVKHVRLRDRTFVVGDDDELALRDESIKHPNETVDVAFIERRIDFVQH